MSIAEMRTLNDNRIDARTVERPDDLLVHEPGTDSMLRRSDLVKDL